MKWLVLTLVVAVGTWGCDGDHGDAGHDHDEADHTHDEAGHGHDGEEGHHHTAPHDGTLVVLGEEFAHLELVLDSASGGLTCYVLDGHAEKGERLAQPEIVLTVGTEGLPLTLSAQDNALTGETVGDSSEFRGNSDALKNVQEFEATVESITIKGRKFESVRLRFPEGNE